MADGSRHAQGVRLVAPTVFDVGVLSMQMRSDEVQQWCALTGCDEYDPEKAAAAIIGSMGPFTFCMVDSERHPIVLAGFNDVRPGVMASWMIGTPDGWAKHWRAITKHGRRVIDELLMTGRAHRIEEHALASRTAAHEWYERGLGMTRQGVVPGYFADGQDAVAFYKIRRQP